MKNLTNVFEWDDLAQFLGVEKQDDRAEKISEASVDNFYTSCRCDCIEECCCQAQCDRQHEEYCSEQYERYRDALFNTADMLMRHHGMTLTRSLDDGEVILEPLHSGTTGWYRAASKLITTINGVGMFEFNSVREFLESGPYASLKQAVLNHVHWAAMYSEVYEGTKAKNLVYRYLRRG